MLDFEKICSFCGSTEDILLYNVFEPDEGLDAYSVSLPFRIKGSLQIEVVQGDKICHSCLYQVNSFHIFKEFSRQTYKTLHKTLEKLCPTPDNKTDAANKDVQVLEERIQKQAMVELPKQEFAANPVTAPETAVVSKAAETAGVTKVVLKAAETAGVTKAAETAGVTKAAPKVVESSGVSEALKTAGLSKVPETGASKAAQKVAVTGVSKAAPKAVVTAGVSKAVPKVVVTAGASKAMVTAGVTKAAPKVLVTAGASKAMVTAGASKAAPRVPEVAGVSKAEQKVLETVGARKAPETVGVPKAAAKARETVLNDIPGSSGTSRNSTNQRAPVNNIEPVRKGKRPWASPPVKTASVRLKCHEEQHAASIEFRNELIQVNNALALHEEPILNEGKCNVCLKFFTSTYLLKRHLISHSSLRPFVCQICSKTFKDHSYLVKHERIHLRQSKQLTCVYCDLPFTLKSNLDRHLKNIHYVDSKSDSDVEVTAQVVTNNSDDRESSSSPDYPVVCRLCLRTFRDVEGLNKHRAAHEKEIFQCNECPETFSEQSNLEKHRNYLHAVCETCLCPKLYECCCDSKRRKRTANQLTCPQCSRSFPDTFLLAMHLSGCRKAKKIVEKEIVLID